MPGHSRSNHGGHNSESHAPNQAHPILLFQRSNHPFSPSPRRFRLPFAQPRNTCVRPSWAAKRFLVNVPTVTSLLAVPTNPLKCSFFVRSVLLYVRFSIKQSDHDGAPTYAPISMHLHFPIYSFQVTVSAGDASRRAPPSFSHRTRLAAAATQCYRCCCTRLSASTRSHLLF